MKEFFALRLEKHQKKMLKYMRYVLNDHFILVLLFLLGVLAVSYSGFLKTLPENFVWSRPIALGVWWLLLFAGNFVTLLEPADEIFILPKEAQMKSYFKKAWGYSLVFPAVLLLLVCGITLPLLFLNGFQMTDFIWFFASLCLLKAGQLGIQLLQIYRTRLAANHAAMGIFGLAALVSLALGLYFTPLAALVGSLLVVVGVYLKMQQVFTSSALDWELATAKEQSRQHRIYRFINLFTDVPGMASSAKRRKIFDGVLRMVPATHENTYLYLYSRSFVRGQQYSGLFLRLVLVAGTILFFLPQTYLAAGISALFLYLIGFQLLPIYHQYDYMMMASLYPIPEKMRIQAVEKLVALLLGVAFIVFGLIIFSTLPHKLEAVGVIALLLAEIFLFVKVYMPKRLKKMARR